MGEAALPIGDQIQRPTIVPYQIPHGVNLQEWESMIQISSPDENNTPSKTDMFFPEKLIGNLAYIGGSKFLVLKNEIKLSEKQAALLIKIINDYGTKTFSISDIATSLKIEEYNVRCMVLLINTSILYQGVPKIAGKNIFISDDKNTWRLNPDYIAAEG